MSLAILVPVCSRGQNYKNINDCHFFNILYPSYLKTTTETDRKNHKFFIGIDSTDDFFQKNKSQFESYGFHVVNLTECEHKVAKAWNFMFKTAFDLGFEYFYQLADDVKIITPGWTTCFIECLQRQENIGVVGPCDMNMYFERILQGHRPIIENCFVHKKHYEIFGLMFHSKIDNIFCDDWITEIYERAGLMSFVHTRYSIENNVRNGRYNYVQQPEIHKYVQEGVKTLTNYIFENNLVLPRKIISFCLWGENPKYTLGAVENAKAALNAYPSWTCRYYVAKCVPVEIIEILRSFPNTEIIIVNETGNWTGMFWRFLPAGEKGIDYMISRDTDSRLNWREKAAVNEWLYATDKPFHIMRDHPYHGKYILGGMWGVKVHKNLINNIDKLINEHDKENKYDVDQEFLGKRIYPLVKDNILIHDEWFVLPDEKRVCFPTPRFAFEFVGEIFDSGNKRGDEYKIIVSILSNKMV